MEFLSQPSDHLNGREWVEWKKKGLMRECEAISHNNNKILDKEGK
jgi:hypothetical protein